MLMLLGVSMKYLPMNGIMLQLFTIQLLVINLTSIWMVNYANY
jgi:hypothetical protein